MAKEMDRRQFLKTVAGGAVGAAGLSMLGGIPLGAAESKPPAAAPAFEGKRKFAGVHNTRPVTEDIIYLGVSDDRLALFENVYPIPRGISYNAYLLKDEKTVLFDTVDRSVSGQFFENLAFALDGRALDYLVINHMEPDHCSAVTEVLTRWPGVQLLCSQGAEPMLRQFFGLELSRHGRTVAEGETLNTGRHQLTFIMAPMVHWPEAMMTYDAADKVLFSADAFGSFGSLGGNLFADEVNFEADWLPDARRYYTNIVGKYGRQVQDVLGKAAGADIAVLCPLHGPVWRQDLGWLLEKYRLWSSYTPEEEAALVLYGSVYGGTENAARVLASALSRGGLRNVAVYDVSKTHVSVLIAEAFRCSHLVAASITYNMDLFTPMKQVLQDFAAHNLKDRGYALVENGSWSPAAGRRMRELLDGMEGMRQLGETLTIHSTTDEQSAAALQELASTVLADMGRAAAPVPAQAEPAAATRWVCGVCGYIEEAEELPEDFVCPVCGVGRDKFTKME